MSATSHTRITCNRCGFEANDDVGGGQRTATDAYIDHDCVKHLSDRIHFMVERQRFTAKQLQRAADALSGKASLSSYSAFIEGITP